ncbi:MAG: hypothetical protein J6W75_00865 [Bacteroidaceae bacterium]|nr:hypothetical protein [Bacteroidaceae bacterium]
MPSTVPDFLFLDAVSLAYRLGQIRYDEQRQALLAAAQTATDALSFMKIVEEHGVGQTSQLHSFLGHVLAAPAYYRATYTLMLGLRKEGEEAEPFLQSTKVLGLVEPFLTVRQRKLFYDAFWWFVRNHQPQFADSKKGMCIGAYATDPKDNASALVRFEDYLSYLVNHRSLAVRQRFDGFPTDIVIAILKRTFL